MSSLMYTSDPAASAISKGIARLSMAPNTMAPLAPAAEENYQLAEIGEQCTAFIKRFDAWISSKKRVLSENRATHTRKVNDLKETEMQLKSQIEQYKSKETDLQRTYQKQRKEFEDMEAQVSDLKLQLEEREGTREELSERVRDMKSNIRQRREELARKREARLAQHERNLTPELECFLEKLAMDMKGLGTCMVKIIFTHIHQKSWDKEYTFTLDVRKNLYKVVECEPRIQTLDELVDWLNKTKDFHMFLKIMRRGFVDAAKLEVI